MRAAAQTLGLTRVLDLAVRQLSAGQRRRLALARLIASPRSLWLLDEPLAPLDAQHRALFGELTGHVTAQWQITGGARFFKQDFESSSYSALPYCGSYCGRTPPTLWAIRRDHPLPIPRASDVLAEAGSW